MRVVFDLLRKVKARQLMEFVGEAQACVMVRETHVLKLCLNHVNRTFL